MNANRRSSIAIAVLGAVLPATSSAAELCGKTVADVPALIAALSAPRDDRVSEDPAYIAVQDKVELTLWTVTKQGNPAHPAVVCRKPFEKDGAVLINMQATCGGPKEACDKMMAQFTALNEQMKNDIKNSRK
jgi:hypothetical protein